MKTKLIISIIGLLTLSLCSACVSEAERQRIEAEKQRQAEIARVEAEKAEKERAERERLARIELERIQKARQEREAKEAAERAERERLEGLREKADSEKRIIAIKLDLISKDNQKLSNEEHSRGNALLLAFANEHLPLFAEKYKAIRTKTLEAEANFNELLAALKADGLDPQKDETAQALSKNLRNLHVSYWTIRYKITDFYSQFKIGVITPEELAKADEELSPLY